MTDVADTKVPYEILIRFGSDGKPVGAHVQYLRRVILGDEVLKEEILPAQPIDIEGFPTSEMMSDIARDALAKVTEQTASLSDQAAKIVEQAAEIDSLSEKLCALLNGAGAK